MDNIVFEKDYSETRKQPNDNDESIEILKQAISGGFLKNYEDAMNAIPKVIVPEYKANYEYILQQCDDLAKRSGGSIRGVVDYERWQATINVIIPSRFIEFTSPEELQLLRDIAEKSHGVTIEPVDGGIRIFIYNLYFEELVSSDERAYIEYENILEDEKLAEMLGIPSELSPELEAATDYLNGLLDTLEKATGQDRTALFKKLLFRIASNLHEVDNVYEAIEKIVQDIIDESRPQ